MIVKYVIFGGRMRDKIKALLKVPGWNQQRLADELKVSIHTVKSWNRITKSRKPGRWIQSRLLEIFEEEGIL